MHARIIVCLLVFVAACAQRTLAEEQPQVDSSRKAQKDSPKALDFFESKIRPVLVKHCYDCHSEESGATEGGLQLDSRQAVRKGGKRGPAVVPHKPEASLLLAAVSHSDSELKMPPKQERLPDAVIADFKTWIEMGAPDPRIEKARATSDAVDAADLSGKLSSLKADGSFWAYQPPKNVKTPPVGDKGWARQELDHFILAKLEENGLAPSLDAEPHVLLRRVHFDLIGLPPSPEEIEQFRRRIKASGLEEALAGVVDELLVSPSFGEKWGRHWLDVARFGESSGGEANISFPYAWRYRDYIIDSINADVPFDRFLVEQIAGDLLPYESEADRARLLIATGFLAIGPKNLDEANGFQFLADVIDEQIDAVTRAVIASSVACARCHDHKFDPFTMQDYYALAGIFASTKTYFGTAVSPANRVAGDPLPLPRMDELKVFHESIPAKRVASLKEELAAMQQEKKEKQAAVQKAIAEGKDPSDIFTIRDALRIFWRSGAIEGQLEKVDESGKALPLAMGVLDRDKMVDVPLLERGDINKPTEPVPRRFPEVIQLDDSLGAPPVIDEDQSGRLALARWLTHPRHPLTSRVIVNRLWSYLFGAGLVRTVDNFGATGERPSHPELLDYLAIEFVNNGWSIKQFVREMVLSRTYRQTSSFNRQAFLKDPDNRLLWRMSKRRLDAEAIRDAMLAASGQIDLSRPEGSLVGRVIGDRPISLIGLDKRIPRDLDGSVHRSVYLPIIRDRLPDVLDLFDFAEPSLVTGDRETTNVPLQALYLMNSPFVQERSAALASRLKREAQTKEQQVKRAFLLCFGRTPDPAELQRSLTFLNKSSEPKVLTSFCQALLCAAEFRNLD